MKNVKTVRFEVFAVQSRCQIQASKQTNKQKVAPKQNGSDILKD